jgi:glycine cleavage system H protein
MPIHPTKTLYYKKSRFSTRLPLAWKYAPSHYWLRPTQSGTWEIGLTKFATRMLGDFVEHDFTVPPGGGIIVGQAIGWLEGFKAITDIYSAMNGEFLGGNPALDADLSLLDRDNYDAGWIYSVRGEPGDDLMDAAEYTGLLDVTIEKMLQQRDQENTQCPKPGS